MNSKRLVATVLAIVLVVGAFVVRQTVLDDDDNGGADDPDRDSSGQLYCITELEDVCRSLETDLAVTIEDAAATLDRLTALEEGAPAPLWLTIEPYPAMVDQLREVDRRDPLAYESAVIAASQLGVALPADGRDAVLDERCIGTPLWRCIGDHAGDRWGELDGEQRWGTLRPAFGDVDTSGLALASFAAAVAGYFNTPDVRRSQWEAEAAFLPWVRTLAGAASSVSLSGGSALGTMRTRPSALDAAATASFEVDALGAASEQYDLNYPEPEMWLQVVLATPGGVAASDVLASSAAALLVEAGWDEPAAAVAPLPNASTMVALQQLWTEAS